MMQISTYTFTLMIIIADFVVNDQYSDRNSTIYQVMNKEDIKYYEYIQEDEKKYKYKYENLFG